MFRKLFHDLFDLTSNSSNQKNEFALDKLPEDIIKRIALLLLLDTHCVNMKSFYNLSLTCRICTKLTNDVFEMEINQSLGVYYALTNNEAEDAPYGLMTTSYSPNQSVFKRKQLLPVTNYDYKTNIQDQANNQRPTTYTIYAGYKRARIAQYTLRTETSNTTKFQSHDKETIISHPIIWEVYCNKDLVNQDHSAVPHNALFFMRSFCTRFDEKSGNFISSPTHSFFQIAQAKQKENKQPNGHKLLEPAITNQKKQ
jgi:hypothetical protein